MERLRECGLRECEILVAWALGLTAGAWLMLVALAARG